MESGLDPNLQTKEGQTSLHIVVIDIFNIYNFYDRFGKFDKNRNNILIELFKYNANPNIKYNSMTPLKYYYIQMQKK